MFMIKKLIILFYIPSLLAQIPNNILHSDVSLLKKSFYSKPITFLEFQKQLTHGRFGVISHDPENLINDMFEISSSLKSSVNFWFNIYTRYDENFVVIHDKNHHNLVYDSIDFSELYKSSLNTVTKANLKNQIVKERIKEIHFGLTNLISGKKSDKIQQTIIDAIRSAKIRFPSKKIPRQKFYRKLLRGLRAQTGLRNVVEKGFINYEIYRETIGHYFDLSSVPPEIIAIPFVESSFNTKAVSRANAVGVWQFIYTTGKFFLPVEKKYDTRRNVLISSLAAIHLLKQNYKILGDWPLAVVAHNSGTKHIILAKKKLKNKKITVDNFFSNYQHPNLGFASRNYYSEFLAMVYAIAYKKYFFFKEKPDKPWKGHTNKIINLYLVRCNLDFKKFLKTMNKFSNNIRQLNPHLLSKRIHPRGTIISSDITLTKKQFYRIQNSKLLRLYPKNFKKLLKGQSCSTR